MRQIATMAWSAISEGSLMMSVWFAVQARTGFEHAACAWLRRSQIETLLPLTRQRQRRLCQNRYVVQWINRPYFPGYFFVREPRDFRLVNDVPHVVRVLGSDEPLPVQGDFIARLRAAMNAHGIVGSTKLLAGMPAHLTEGLFANQSCEIVQDAGKRVMVMLQILGAVRSVNVRAEQVECDA
jgi:transcription antitermination factor NusG